MYETVWRRYGQDVIICEGGADGADKMARELAKKVGWDSVTYWANWTRYYKSAGPIRNCWMLDSFKPQLCVAFPGGPGTQNMVSICKDNGIEVLDFRK